jgi:NAD(P)-dependent dehydrogenase (short-subunit alcohol dehydrogenase family)
VSGRHALVVGATKGLGLGLVEKYRAEGWSVTATTVELSPALEALEGVDVRPLDITDVDAVTALRESFSNRKIDVLHIVAGVFQASFGPIWEQPGEEILRVLNTNAIAGVRMAELFSPLVPTGGVFAFTTSGMGSMERNVLGDVDLYRISKASLNMLARSFAVRHADSGRAVLLLCPGWAKTDMGGPDATVEVAESVGGMYALVAAAKPSREAHFFEYSGDVVAW